MQIDDILLLRMNRQYLFAPAKDELTVLRDLCGLQSQFYGNCLHALRLRYGKAPDEDILRTSAVKTWTLRGTLHLIALDDLPLFLYDGRSHFLRPCDTMENDDHLSAARKRELAAIILDAAQSGCGGREAEKGLPPLSAVCTDDKSRRSARSHAALSDTLRPRNSTGRRILLRTAPARAASGHRIALPA